MDSNYKIIYRYSQVKYPKSNKSASIRKRVNVNLSKIKNR